MGQVELSGSELNFDLGCAGNIAYRIVLHIVYRIVLQIVCRIVLQMSFLQATHLITRLPTGPHTH